MKKRDIRHKKDRQIWIRKDMFEKVKELAQADNRTMKFTVERLINDGMTH